MSYELSIGRCLGASIGNRLRKSSRHDISCMMILRSVCGTCVCVRLGLAIVHMQLGWTPLEPILCLILFFIVMSIFGRPMSRPFDWQPVAEVEATWHPCTMILRSVRGACVRTRLGLDIVHMQQKWAPSSTKCLSYTFFFIVICIFGRPMYRLFDWPPVTEVEATWHLVPAWALVPGVEWTHEQELAQVPGCSIRLGLVR